MQVVIGIIELALTLFLSTQTLNFLKSQVRDSFKFKVHEQIMEITFDILNELAQSQYKMKPYVHYYPSYEANQLKIQPSNDYCIRSDTYKYFHPEVIMNDLHVVREESVEIPKKIVRELTFDGLPFLVRYRKLNSTRAYKHEWPIQASQLFMHYEHLPNEFKHGTEILCLFQKYNHIPGKFSISHKNNLMDNFHRQLDQLIKDNKSEECIANASYIPKTYRLYRKSECLAFFSYLNSSEYQEKLDSQGPQFITKAGQEVHRGRGITVLFKEESADLQNQYAFGNLCDEKKAILIAQRYINNPYLYKNHKIEFRIYFTITSTDPLIVHVYKKALIKRCAKPFSIFSTEKASHVCNTAIVKKTIDTDNEINDDVDPDPDELTETKEIEIEEEEYFIDWYLEGLQALLLEQNKINDTNWLENRLYPQVYKSIIHLVRSGEYKLHVESRVAEFFAVDFILSDDLEIYVLECNYNPQILSVTPERIKRNYKMMMDTLEIYQAYTRSRYIRIKRFVKKLLIKASKVSQATLGIKKQMLYTNTAYEFVNKALDDPKFKKEFFTAMKEKLEREVSISPKNLYEKVIDMNLQGEAAFHNLIKNECL